MRFLKNIIKLFLLLPITIYALPQGPFIKSLQKTEDIVWQKGGNPAYLLQPRLGYYDYRFIDLDNDGDMDLMAFYSSEDFSYFGPFYFENIGDKNNPAYVKVAHPFNHTAPLIPADLDGDGKLNFIQSDYSTSQKPQIKYLEPTSSAFIPEFLEIQTTAFDNVLSNSSFPESYYFSFEPLDIDADGDIDFIASKSINNKSVFTYIENIGTQYVANFMEHQGIENPWETIVWGDLAALDVDQDSDIDLVIAQENILRYIENIGSATMPTYLERLDTANPLNTLELTDVSDLVPHAVDLDGDNDEDLVLGRQMLYLENQGATATPQFVLTENIWDGFHTTRPVMLDPDGDQDWDIIVSDYPGRLGYFENIGTPQHPHYLKQSNNSLKNPFYKLGSFQLYSLAPIDPDNDGDTDLLTEAYDGSLGYLENIGTPTMPQYVERKDVENPWQNVNIIDSYGTDQFPSNFTIFDVDGDADLDLVLGGTAGKLRYLENTGTNMSPQYLEHTDARNPWHDVDLEWYSKPVAVDFDNDGDMDLMVTTNASSVLLHYFENIGHASSPQYIERQGMMNPWNRVAVDSREGVHIAVDLDADGDWDMLASDDSGTLHYFENLNLPDHVRAFNWAEQAFADALPQPSETLELAPLYIRAYPTNGVYLAYNSANEHVYSFTPPYQQLIDLGLLSDYLELVSAQGY